MGGQRKTLIPSKLKYITLLSHQINNSEVKSIIGFNLSIYNNTIDYLWLIQRILLIIIGLSLISLLIN